MRLKEKELLEWLDKCWSLYKTSQDEWKLSELAYWQIREMIQKKEVEIIGNIYENPELIRSKKS